MTDELQQFGDDGVENLSHLMDYTKFHIGVSITLFGAAVTAIEKSIFPSETWPMLRLAALLLALAGMCGGVIGSSIPDARSFAQFRTKILGPRWLPGIGLKYDAWAGLEHLFFWLATVLTAWALIGPPSWHQ